MQFCPGIQRTTQVTVTTVEISVYEDRSLRLRNQGSSSSSAHQEEPPQVFRCSVSAARPALPGAAHQGIRDQDADLSANDIEAARKDRRSFHGVTTSPK